MMDLTSLQDQVDTIRTAFSYIGRFKGQTFVIRLEGSLLGHPLFPLLVKDIVLLKRMGIRIILVPGARKRIDEILATYNIVCQTVGNIRVTPEEAMPFVKMAAFDVSNQIMTILAEDNCDAIIGNWVKARRLGVIDGVDYQCSGAVEKVKTEIINGLLDAQFIPIFPNIGWSGTGRPYNISSNELAFTVAREVKASKLFFITDFGGIGSDGFDIPEDVYISGDNIISQLTTPQARAFLERNQGKQRTLSYELVSLAYRACQSGIDRVHIIDGRVEGMLLKEIFSNRGLGTMIYGDPHENIRQATHADIPEILHLMQPFVNDKILIPRTREDIEAAIADYALYEVDGTLHGSGALHVFPDKTAEIAGIAVDRLYSNLGIGRKLISFLLEKSVRLSLEKVFLLTTQTADWFLQMGFTEGDPSMLPPARREKYNALRNSQVLVYDLSLHNRKKSFGVE
ncbi:MAG TPA: amino-acid N-acetyltransferase [Spirochaetia bacterium]|nr:amino-acid N-acetyltransferase [Spirochaetia bacterium]